MYENRQLIEPLIEQTADFVRSIYHTLLSATDELVHQDADFARFSRALIGFVAERTQAVIWLVQGGYLWDSDMLTRPMAEGTVRILFCCFCSHEERKVRVLEFSKDLLEIAYLKQSDRAKLVLQITSYSDEWNRSMSPMILDQCEEAAMRDRWPSKRRRLVESRWSMFEMLRSVDQYSDQNLGFSGARIATHTYGNSSHFLHADILALELTRDRIIRPEKERERLASAHAVRLLSDCAWYMRSILGALRISHKLSIGTEKLDDSLKQLSTQFRGVEEEFWRNS